jgi:hypothetical protein
MTMTFRPGSWDTEHPSKTWLPQRYMYVISCGHVLLFPLSIFHCDDLDFPAITNDVKYVRQL